MNEEEKQTEVIEEGKTGLLFQLGNGKELKEKILFLSKNRVLLHSMRIKAREIAEQKYSEERGYKNLLEIYEQILSK